MVFVRTLVNMQCHSTFCLPFTIYSFAVYFTNPLNSDCRKTWEWKLFLGEIKKNEKKHCFSFSLYKSLRKRNNKRIFIHDFLDWRNENKAILVNLLNKNEKITFQKRQKSQNYNVHQNFKVTSNIRIRWKETCQRQQVFKVCPMLFFFFFCRYVCKKYLGKVVIFTLEVRWHIYLPSFISNAWYPGLS